MDDHFFAKRLRSMAKWRLKMEKTIAFDLFTHGHLAVAVDHPLLPPGNAIRPADLTHLDGGMMSASPSPEFNR